MALKVSIKAGMIIALLPATKEMETPEETAEKVGITALIIQVNWD